MSNRWRCGLPTEPLAEPCLFDPQLQIAAAGDWGAGPRAEGAVLSGCAAAGRVLSLRPRGSKEMKGPSGAAQRSLFED